MKVKLFQNFSFDSQFRTIDTEKDNWHSFYYGGDAVVAAGENTLGTATATVPYATLK